MNVGPQLQLEKGACATGGCQQGANAQEHHILQSLQRSENKYSGKTLTIAFLEAFYMEVV